MPRLTPTNTALLLGFSSFFLFTLCDALVKATNGVLGLHQAVFANAITGLALAILTAILKQKRYFWRAFRPSDRNWTGVVVCSVSIIFSTYLIWYGFRHLPFTDVYALVFAMPFGVVLLSALLLKEHVNTKQILCLIGGFVGVLIVLRPSFATINGAMGVTLLGVAFACVRAFTLRAFSHNTSPLCFTFYTYFSLTSASVIATLTTDQTLFDPSVTASFWLLGAGVLSYAGVYMLSLAYRYAGPVVVSPTNYSQMIWGLLIGLLFFGETPDPVSLVGSLVLIGFSYLLVKSHHAAAK